MRLERTADAHMIGGSFVSLNEEGEMKGSIHDGTAFRETDQIFSNDFQIRFDVGFVVIAHAVTPFAFPEPSQVRHPASVQPYPAPSKRLAASTPPG